MARYLFNLPPVQPTQKVRLDTASGSDSPAADVTMPDGTAVSATLTSGHDGLLPEVYSGSATLYLKRLTYGGTVTGSPQTLTGSNQSPSAPTSGGSLWTLTTLSLDLADWTDDSVGTWTADGTTIRQTDPTASGAHLTTVAKFGGPTAIIEAVVKIPTGQDAGTFPEVHMGFFAFPSGAKIDEWTSGWALAPVAAGDTGPFDVTVVGDGGLAAITGADTVDIDTTHTLRAVVDLITQAVYLDGVLSLQGVVVPPIATDTSPGPCHVSLYATGLVELSALKVWTLTLP